MTTSDGAWRGALILALGAGIVIAAMRPAIAVAPDECEKQRARFPADWSDVSAETPVYDCRSHYSGALRITLGRADDRGRRPMSVVPMRGAEPSAFSRDPDRPVRRIWLDADQARRLEKGEYFATVVRGEESCWIRGDLAGDPVFFLDAARVAPDTDDAGAFYNKAPRLTVYAGDSYECTHAGRR